MKNIGIRLYVCLKNGGSTDYNTTQAGIGGNTLSGQVIFLMRVIKGERESIASYVHFHNACS